MNNEANRDNQCCERRFFDWLLQQPTTSLSDQEEEGLNLHLTPDQISGMENLVEELDPLDSEEIEVFPSHSQGFTLGEIPIVKNRFETVLRERLKATIQLNPPLFPWEPDGTDLQSEYPDAFREEQVPMGNLWIAHQQHLRWSIFLPERVFDQLLVPCQKVVQSTLQQGAKLVQVVHTLFPNQPETLNELASLVMLGPLRSERDLTESQPCYETATPEQQMVLLLLAAQEILQTLTLNCGLNQPAVHQDWLTTLGQLRVEVEYVQTDYGAALKILGHLPAGGRLQLFDESRSTTAQRKSPGYLKLELIDPEPNRIYRLHVLLHSDEQNPLCFAICPQPQIEERDSTSA